MFNVKITLFLNEGLSEFPISVISANAVTVCMTLSQKSLCYLWFLHLLYCLHPVTISILLITSSECLSRLPGRNPAWGHWGCHGYFNHFLHSLHLAVLFLPFHSEILHHVEGPPPLALIYLPSTQTKIQPHERYPMKDLFFFLIRHLFLTWKDIGRGLGNNCHAVVY